MERRKFLLGIGSAAVVSASGCMDSIAERGNLNGGGTDTESGRTGGANEPVQMKLSLVSADAGPGPLSYDVTVTGNQLSATAVPNLEIAVENTGDESVRWSYTGQTSDLPFPQGVHDTETGTLVVGLDEEIRSQLMEADSGCARVDEFVGADGIKNTTLDPGQRHEREYAVVGVDGELSAGCPKPDTYRIEEEFGDLGTWGFDVRLE